MMEFTLKCDRSLFYFQTRLLVMGYYFNSIIDQITLFQIWILIK